MVGQSLGLDNAEVSHIVHVALLADFLVSVTIQLKEFVFGDATLAVKAIIVLSNNSFNNVSVNEFLHCHVAFGWETWFQVLWISNLGVQLISAEDDNVSGISQNVSKLLDLLIQDIWLVLVLNLFLLRFGYSTGKAHHF